jgi:hypothetical protein
VTRDCRAERSGSAYFPQALAEDLPGLLGDSFAEQHHQGNPIYLHREGVGWAAPESPARRVGCRRGHYQTIGRGPR